MRHRTGATNTNQRGSSHQRRARKTWLLSPQSGHGGDGETVPCAFGCGTVLTFATLWVDRHPILGDEGGTYRRDNIRPACAPCQTRQGAAITNRKRGRAA